MQVSIDHEERQRGILKKKTYYEIHVHVDFTDEEKEIIKKNDLKRYVILERGPRADIGGAPQDQIDRGVFNLEVRQVMDRTDEYAVSTPYEAKLYEEDVKEALKKLKSILEGANEAGESRGSSTFEL